MKRKTMFTCIVLIIALICNSLYVHGDPKKFEPEQEKLLEMGEATITVIKKDIDYDEIMNRFKERYPLEYETYYEAKYGDDISTKENEKIGGDLLQSAIEIKRSLFREEYSKTNSEFIQRYAAKSEIVFLSEYSPMVIVKATHDEILNLFNAEETLYVEEFKNLEGKNESLGLANLISRADYLRDTIGLTGTGVKIGMVEAEGVPDASVINLSSANLFFKSGDTNPDLHATLVARIMVGADSTGSNDGIAPNASLYCCKGKYTSTFLSGVEWLINSGVNVINASMGFGGTGTYDTLSAWVDHIAVMHDIHFVKSAGNDNGNNKYVTSPGMAYNAMTVGGLNPTDGDDWDDVDRFLLAGFSCYNETGTYRPEKPNLIADAIDFWGFSGTSYAAPQVAATIAQLCCYDSVFKTKQSTVGSILMASAARKAGSSGPGEVGDTFSTNDRIDSNPQISEKEGAGILDSRWAYEVANNGMCWSPTIYDASFPYTKNFTITATPYQYVRVCIFWLKQNSLTNHTNSSTTQTPFSNLKLTVKDPNGSIVGSSDTTYSNYEIVQFASTVSGTYTITIEDLGGNTGKEYVGIAVWYGNQP